VAHREVIAGRLLAAGMPAGTPVLAVHWGTRPEQRSVRVRLDELGATVLEPPVTMVIGPVAALELDWYERRPLLGRTVVVTRARSQASGLSARLRDLGARIVEVPTIRIDGPADGGAGLGRAVAELGDGRYEWVVFSSPNAVSALLERVPDARLFGSARLAAMGPGTADALSAWHLVPDLVPDRAIAEGMLEAFPDPAGPGSRVLLPRAAEGRDRLPDGLRAAGWEVDDVAAYRTVRMPLTGADRDGVARADAVCFASASSVTGLLAATGGPDEVPRVVVCIGPSTASAAAAGGLQVTAVAREHTIPGLVEALVGALS
jgi:uroporphyrinogen III methyltransferase/synthase